MTKSVIKKDLFKLISLLWTLASLRENIYGCILNGASTDKPSKIVIVIRQTNSKLN